jgi:low affinity Fe/Cu permease
LYPGVAWTLAIAIVVAVLALLPVVFIDRGRDRIEEELRRAPDASRKDRP